MLDHNLNNIIYTGNGKRFACYNNEINILYLSEDDFMFIFGGMYFEGVVHCAYQFFRKLLNHVQLLHRKTGLLT